MFLQSSHTLRPLTKLTGDKLFIWGAKQQIAFDEMKAVMAANCLNAYPDLNWPFDIVCDASDYQLGAAILQKGRPLAYYSRTLQSAETSYTTTEKELLSILETLKEYRPMLYGGRLKVYTDHKNLTFCTMSINRIL